MHVDATFELHQVLLLCSNSNDTTPDSFYATIVSNDARSLSPQRRNLSSRGICTAVQRLRPGNENGKGKETATTADTPGNSDVALTLTLNDDRKYLAGSGKNRGVRVGF
jgi:hypothetical protein